MADDPDELSPFRQGKQSQESVFRLTIKHASNGAKQYQHVVREAVHAGVYESQRIGSATMTAFWATLKTSCITARVDVIHLGV